MNNPSKHQKFEMRVIDRRDIHLADYNPRTISKDARQRLKATLREVGLIQPLIWNQRTGVLVSGHQRLSVLDEFEHYTPGGERSYTLEVAVVDLDEKQERRMNVFLNNASAMGEFDFDALNDLRLEFDLDAGDLGFSAEDIEVMFPVEIPPDLGDTADARDAKELIGSMAKKRDDVRAKFEQNDGIAYYFTVVCKTVEEKERLLESFGVPGYEDFIRGELIAARITPPPPQT